MRLFEFAETNVVNDAVSVLELLKQRYGSNTNPTLKVNTLINLLANTGVALDKDSLRNLLDQNPASLGKYLQLDDSNPDNFTLITDPSQIDTGDDFGPDDFDMGDEEGNFGDEDMQVSDDMGGQVTDQETSPELAQMAQMGNVETVGDMAKRAGKNRGASITNY